MPHTWHDTLAAELVQQADISIHMPHTWHDSGEKVNSHAKDKISIHMPHTWHDLGSALYDLAVYISIHMPHTWHDAKLELGGEDFNNFNPHATYVA